MTTFSIPRHSEFHPNWDFWFENKPYGNLGEEHEHEQPLLASAAKMAKNSTASFPSHLQKHRVARFFSVKTYQNKEKIYQITMRFSK
jgi:hypothetical protein